MNHSPQKSILEIRYSPKLIFFDKLYKNEKITQKFPHWQTDKLKVSLQDFDKKHSLTIAHNGAVFESDHYNKENEEEIISILLDEINSFVDDGFFTRFGFRRYYLIKQEISFQELSNIINLKFFTQDFKGIFENKLDDSTITIVSKMNDNNFRMTIGPMKKKEIPNFINIDSHIEHEPTVRVEELNKIFKNYPDVALYLDIDYFYDGKNLTKKSLEEFLEMSKVDIPKIVDSVITNIFENKVKE